MQTQELRLPSACYPCILPIHVPSVHSVLSAALLHAVQALEHKGLHACTSCGSRPTSSCASRSAVCTSSLSVGSRLPPGSATSPAYSRLTLNTELGLCDCVPAHNHLGPSKPLAVRHTAQCKLVPGDQAPLASRPCHFPCMRHCCWRKLYDKICCQLSLVLGASESTFLLRIHVYTVIRLKCSFSSLVTTARVAHTKQACRSVASVKRRALQSTCTTLTLVRAQVRSSFGEQYADDAPSVLKQGYQDCRVALRHLVESGVLWSSTF